MTLSLDTAYRSFGGEVEASSTPTICRLPDSRRHQLWAIAHHAALSISAARFAISQSTPSKLSMCVEKGQAFPVLTSREIPHRAERPREDALPAPAGRSAWSDGIYQRPRRLEFGLAVACIGR